MNIPFTLKCLLIYKAALTYNGKFSLSWIFIFFLTLVPLSYAGNREHLTPSELFVLSAVKDGYVADMDNAPSGKVLQSSFVENLITGAYHIPDRVLALPRPLAADEWI